MQRLQAFWSDESGLVLSAELVFVTSIAAIGVIVGLSAARDGILSELADVGKAVNNTNQSYRVEGIQGHTASLAGTLFQDGSDFCEGVAAQDTELLDEACIARIAPGLESGAPPTPTP